MVDILLIYQHFHVDAIGAVFLRLHHGDVVQEGDQPAPVVRQQHLERLDVEEFLFAAIQQLGNLIFIQGSNLQRLG